LSNDLNVKPALPVACDIRDVVDVTDFGSARIKDGQVAYLVMEYLDGCTLGDVLAEEKSLPLIGW
jgi:hypothetical protein